jgi:hypothetical protein
MLFFPAIVYAEVTADQRQETIRDRCEGIKATLDQLERRDLVSRINRGREYQNISGQVEALAARMRNNKLSGGQLEQQVADLKVTIDNFRATYNRYDNTVAGLIKMDCRAKPAEFGAQLDLARNLRAAVGVEVANINASLTRYREIVVSFQIELERLNNATLGEHIP